MRAKRKTKEQVIKILEDCLQEYKDDESLLYYRYHLNMNALSSSNYTNWCNKGIEDIDELHDILEDIQESRIANELLKKNGLVNTVGGLFMLKCKYGYIEREKLLVIESRDNSIDTDSEILVEFEEVEDEH